MITTERLAQIVENFTGEKIVDSRQILGRSDVNDIYALATVNNKYILRVDRNKNTLDRFRKEVWCVGQARQVGIPVADIVAVDLVDGYPYMLMHQVEGINGDESPGQDKIWRALGGYARKIHAIPVQGYGDRMSAPGVFDDSWQRFLDYNLSSLTAGDQLLERGFITSAQSARLKKIFLNLQQTKFNFGLTHYDLCPRNTVVAADGVYLLDWGSAQVGVIPHLDIAEILDSSLNDQSPEFKLFLENYGLPYEDYETMKPQIRDLNLLVHVDKLRWALDRAPGRVEHYASEVEKKLEKLN
jgi:fructosamine-3-kinase